MTVLRRGSPTDVGLLAGSHLPSPLTIVGVDATKELIAKSKAEGQGVQQTMDKMIAELKQRCHINDRARAADGAADFSQRIRQGVPGTDL